MSRLTMAQAFETAVQHHQAGQLQQAENMCRQILAQHPGHAGALHHLGVIAHQSGRNDTALDLIRQALELQPDYPEAYSNLGNVLREDGQLDEAIAAYRHAIALRPDYPEAHSNLGAALSDNRRVDESIAAYRQAIALKPEDPDDHLHLGNALREKGQLGEAIACFRQAIALRPQYPEALNDLANALMCEGQLDEAIMAYRQSIALAPDIPDLYSNLGNALTDKGLLDEAIAAYRQAIALRPEYPDAYSNLGNALRGNGQLDKAIASCRKAIALKPEYPEANSNLGDALREKGQLEQAIAAYRQAITLKPEYPEAYNNLGNALGDRGQLDNAIAAYRQAIALKPQFPEAYSNLGTVLSLKGQFDKAIAAYRQAIALKPQFPEAYNKLGAALSCKGQLDEAIAAYWQAIALRPEYAVAHSNLGSALKDKGQLGEAIAAYRQAIALRPDYLEAHSNLVFTLYFHSGCDARTIAEEQRIWSHQHAEPLQEFIQPHLNDRNPGRRLRIGYVSPDFRDHCAALFLLPLLRAHDHLSCEIHCFASVAKPDAVTRQLAALADRWHSTAGLSDTALAQLVRDERIDILVDLTLHMAHSRLLVFARKPAPLQVTWLGYPGSTGLNTIDYRLSDPYLDPPGMDESIYSEQTIRLHDAFWCYDPCTSEPSVNDLPASSNGFVTFGCLNNFCKTNVPLVKLWAATMQKIEHSRLVLLAPIGSARQWVIQLLHSEGIDQSRIQFEAARPRADYLQLYQQIDIALDSFPSNGHTTSLDAFWMGVPVVTLAGKMAVSRAGVCQLSNLRLTELIAHTPEQYVQIASELANDRDRLLRLRSTLRQRMEQSPLMDAPRFARNIETAYRQMWRTWCTSCGLHS